MYYSKTTEKNQQKLIIRIEKISPQIIFRVEKNPTLLLINLNKMINNDTKLNQTEYINYNLNS